MHALLAANRANCDSFYFTNSTPQRDTFNQSGRHGEWGVLENALIAEVQLDLSRVSVLVGPVLGEDDPAYRGVQVPLELWKTLVYRVGGALRARSFLLTQSLAGVEAVSRARPDRARPGRGAGAPSARRYGDIAW
ncbi:hypothetical protein BH10ACT10_BH10ACT10_01400 [soil metagenome]